MKQAAKELALDILTNAVETGAIGYYTTNQEWSRNDGMDGTFISILKFEELNESTQEPMEPRKVYTITPEKIIAAMERIAVEKLVAPELHKTITGMWATNDYLAGVGGDAETDSCIVQVAAFGEVRYG